MNSIKFGNIIKQYESILDGNIENEITWGNENDWFQIEPLNENDSIISINFQLEEIRVGIGIVTEYYSDEYEGMEYEKGFAKFIKLLCTKIKREDYFKGKNHYKSNYTFLENNKYELFGTGMTLAFKFWKKTTMEKNIQNPTITSENIKTKLNEIKITTHNRVDGSARN